MPSSSWCSFCGVGAFAGKKPRRLLEHGRVGADINGFLGFVGEPVEMVELQLGSLRQPRDAG